MLARISIRDIVLIDRLDLDFAGGLAVLTGETGAGKSILLDAFALALGARGDASLVRHGADQGQVTAVFELPPDHKARALIAAADIAVEDQLILRRVQLADGRTRAFINDQPVSVQALKGFGAALVEIHGQHDERALVDAPTHRRLLDAYGALAYLRSRPDILTDRIGLHGWSNGGSATLASMAPDAPGLAGHAPDAGFRAAIAFYPACGLKDHFAAIGYRSYAPLRVFVGTADEEISPRVCRELLTHAGGDVRIQFYKDATHDFDDPGRRRQSIPANADALRDVVQQAPAFFASELAGK